MTKSLTAKGMLDSLTVESECPLCNQMQQTTIGGFRALVCDNGKTPHNCVSCKSLYVIDYTRFFKGRSE